MADPFANLPKGQAGAIYADPPWAYWRYDGTVAAPGRPQNIAYDSLSNEQIGNLPVAELAARDCVLFCWVTWPKLPECLDVIRAWGFTYKSCAFDWMKANNKQPDFFQDSVAAQVGMGYWTRANTEPCLLATRGSPKRLHADVRQGIIEPRREHSRKPSCVYERIERLVPGPYIELFARTRRDGWLSWGNEVDKFPSVKAAV